METKHLIHGYEKYCNAIVKAFAEKQDLDFSYWIDRVGCIACFIDQYYFGLEDIILDLTMEMPKGFILEWQNANVECGDSKKHLEYIQYINGVRHERHKH